MTRKMLAPEQDDDDYENSEPLRRKNMSLDDVGASMRRRWKNVWPVLLVAMLVPSLAFLFLPPADAQSPGRSFEWTCSLDDIGATLTQCRQAPDPGTRLYLTDVVITSTTATAGLFLLRSGTGTNCGTATLSLLPSAAAVPRLAYPGSGTSPAHVRLQTPLALSSASALCVICTAVNTCTVQMAGYLAP